MLALGVDPTNARVKLAIDQVTARCRRASSRRGRVQNSQLRAAAGRHRQRVCGGQRNHRPSGEACAALHRATLRLVVVASALHACRPCCSALTVADAAVVRRTTRATRSGTRTQGQQQPPTSTTRYCSLSARAVFCFSESAAMRTAAASSPPCARAALFFVSLMKATQRGRLAAQRASLT